MKLLTEAKRRKIANSKENLEKKDHMPGGINCHYCGEYVFSNPNDDKYLCCGKVIRKVNGQICN